MYLSLILAFLAVFPNLTMIKPHVKTSNALVSTNFSNLLKFKYQRGEIQIQTEDAYSRFHDIAAVVCQIEFIHYSSLPVKGFHVPWTYSGCNQPELEHPEVLEGYHPHSQLDLKFLVKMTAESADFAEPADAESVVVAADLKL